MDEKECAYCGEPARFEYLCPSCAEKKDAREARNEAHNALAQTQGDKT